MRVASDGTWNCNVGSAGGKCRTHTAGTSRIRRCSRGAGPSSVRECFNVVVCRFAERVCSVVPAVGGGEKVITLKQKTGVMH
jgi:hypothetical protein